MMRDRLENLALQLVGNLVRWLPPGTARSVARAIGVAAWRLGIRRRVTDDNIQKAFGEYDAKQRARISRNCYEALALTAAEFLRLTPQTVRQAEMQVEFRGWQHVLDARQRGQGAIIASAHMGNWELWGAAAVAKGVGITFVVQRLRNRAADQALCDRRRSVGMHVMERGMAMRRLGESLDRNHLVAIMCDQDARRRGVFVPFFGRLASTHKGAAQLAFRFGVPLLPFLGFRQDDGTHVAQAFPPLQAAPGSTESEFVQATMEQFHVILETAVRAHPGQYLWQHRRWKTSPPEGTHDGRPAASVGSGGSTGLSSAVTDPLPSPGQGRGRSG